MSTIENAYDEISKWRKNTFLVPFGKTGKEFIDTLKELINKWNNGSEMEFIALKVAIVLLALCLQKPGPKLKSKDHQDCLAKRLVLWKKGEDDTILREGRMIQRRLGDSHRATDPPNRAKIFANLVMTGQVNSALRYLSDDQGGGILPLSDDVMEQLKEKHPEPQVVQLGSLLFGPIRDVSDTLYYEINEDVTTASTPDKLSFAAHVDTTLNSKAGTKSSTTSNDPIETPSLDGIMCPFCNFRHELEVCRSLRHCPYQSAFSSYHPKGSALDVCRESTWRKSAQKENPAR